MCIRDRSNPFPLRIEQESISPKKKRINNQNKQISRKPMSLFYESYKKSNDFLNSPLLDNKDLICFPGFMSLKKSENVTNDKKNKEHIEIITEDISFLRKHKSFVSKRSGEIKRKSEENIFGLSSMREQVALRIDKKCCRKIILKPEKGMVNLNGEGFFSPPFCPRLASAPA